MQAGSVEIAIKVDGRGAKDYVRSTQDVVAGTKKVDAALVGLGGNAGAAAGKLTRLGSAARGLGQDLGSLSRSSSIVGDVFKGALGANLVESGLRGAAAGAKEFISSTMEAAKQAAAVDQALKFATGSAAKGREEFTFLRSEAERLGFDLQTSARGFASLSAAARGTSLAGQGVRDIFTAVSEAGVTLRLSADQQAGALNAIQQMMSKGTVQAEELRGQLGERLPGAFQLAARAMGVSTAQLGKMLEQGEVFSDEFLPKFAKALHEEFATPAEEASKQAQASITKFENRVKAMSATVGSIFLDIAGRGASMANFLMEGNSRSDVNIGMGVSSHNIAADRREAARLAAMAEGLRMAKEAQALERQKTQGPSNAQQGAIDKNREEAEKKRKADAKVAAADAQRAADIAIDIENQVLESKRLARQKLKAMNKDATSDATKAALEDDVKRTNAAYVRLEGDAAAQARDLKIAAMKEGHSQSLALLNAQQQDELNAFKLSAEAKYMTAQQREESIAAIEQRYSNERIALNQAEGHAIAAAAISLTQNLGQVMELAAGKNRTLAKAGMRVSQGVAIASAAAGVMKAFEQGGMLGFFTGAAIAAEGAAQVATIEKQINRFAGGGIVPGNSTSGDRVPAMVNSREMILNQRQQAQLFAMANGRAQGGGGGITFNGGINITIPAGTTPAQARAMGEAAADGIYSRLRRHQDAGKEAAFHGVPG